MKKIEDGIAGFFAIVTILLGIILILYLEACVIIWALNLLFHLGISYSLKSMIAIMIVLGLLQNKSFISVKKSY